MSSNTNTPSALASLTATYTDSEDEDEIMDGSEKPLKESEGRSQQHVDPNSVSVDEESSGDGGKAAKALGGLVSYNDDLIDDEAVDDHYTSDSNMDQESPADAERLPPEESRSSVDMLDLDATNATGEGGEELLGSHVKSRLPPEPQGKCSAELQEKISKLYEKKIKGGLDMNLAIQRNKNFRNPSIYEKLIKYCDIDELGSNYPRDVFDPHEWHESSFYDELAKAQKTEMERREKERKDRTKVEFVSGTAIKKPMGLPGQPQPADTETRRKSKWDQRGVMPPLLMSISAPGAQPLLVQPPFTTSASGTKSTVISAFGSIKKPKL